MNFSKAGILIILFGISLLYGCTQKTLIFSGESDNWSVHYEVKKDDEYRETTGYIRYKQSLASLDPRSYRIKNHLEKENE